MTVSGKTMNNRIIEIMAEKYLDTSTYSSDKACHIDMVSRSLRALLAVECSVGSVVSGNENTPTADRVQESFDVIIEDIQTLANYILENKDG